MSHGAIGPGRVDRLGIGFGVLMAGAAGAWVYDLVTGSIAAGIAALFMFAGAAVIAGLALPFPLALVSPLFLGLGGWLVDMMPLVMLAGGATVVARWSIALVKERRMPRGGRWVWLPVFLIVWTTLGIVVVPPGSFKHFLLVVGMQVIASGLVLAVVDTASALETRTRIASGLALFVVICAAGSLAQNLGVPVESLQDRDVSDRVEEAYGLDAYSSDTGMVRYVLSSIGGAGDVRDRLSAIAQKDPSFPKYKVMEPHIRLFDSEIPIKFEGSARDVEDSLDAVDGSLIFDNVALAASNKVPRWRSFARNSLTFAGSCVAVLPFAFYLAWAGEGRRRWLGKAAVAACLFGAGFSLARGSWIAIAIGVIYLVVEGKISKRRKLQVVGALLGTALLLTGFYFVKYETSPLDARAAGQASVSTRETLYRDTVESLTGIHFVLGFATEDIRTQDDTGAVVNERYIPRAGTHSTYLNYLFRTGIPGVLAILSLYTLSALHARAGARFHRDKDQLFSTVAAGAVVAVAAHAVVLSLYVEPIYAFVISLVLGLAMAGNSGLPATVIPWRSKPGLSGGTS